MAKTKTITGKPNDPDNRTRCWGDAVSGLMRDYHDLEWGTPLHDDR